MRPRLLASYSVLHTSHVTPCVWAFGKENSLFDLISAFEEKTFRWRLFKRQKLKISQVEMMAKVFPVKGRWRLSKSATRAVLNRKHSGVNGVEPAKKCRRSSARPVHRHSLNRRTLQARLKKTQVWKLNTYIFHVSRI